jgi:GDP-L-fucose synthase
MNSKSKIYIAGHRGMVGSAIVRKLQSEGFNNLILTTSSELDLRQQDAVARFFKQEKPDYVFIAAAKVGGIHANNTRRAEFIYDNLQIQNNLIHQSYVHKVTKLLFLGSSCIYPKGVPQPMSENQLLTGTLEPTNEPYAIAKIAGIKMCEAYRDQYGCNFIAAMPTNLYGPNDNYDLESSHVLPALLRKFIEAKESRASEVVMWGTGSPIREFMHVDDLADALLYVMLYYDDREFINVGSGEELSILELAKLIKLVVGYAGDIVHDYSKPDGTPRKLMSSDRLHQLGWKAKTSLSDGIQQVYQAISADRPW